MKDTFRRSMSWLHTWVGLLLGWVLYFVFITGTAGYVDTELDRWMRPELPMAIVERDLTLQTAVAQQRLTELAPDNATSWYIDYPISRNQPYLTIWWHTETEGWQERYIDSKTGNLLSGRETAGGQTLYRMHWQLHYLPRTAGEWIVGFATMFMLLALITGIIIHRKIFVDFFSFRPGKGPRAWLDAHNVSSILSLPFQLMITYSGLIFMMFTYMPLVIAAWYGAGPENRQRFFDEAFPAAVSVEASGQPVPSAPLTLFIMQTKQHWQGAAISSLELTNPHDANARVTVSGDIASDPVRAANTLVFDGVSGELLVEQAALTSGAKSFRDVMLGLHEGLFASPFLRVLYVISGLLGAAMIATGLILWSTKRRERAEKAQQQPHHGLRLVEKLNVATILGLPIAIAAYFWANRLLPVEMSNRAEWEMHCLFLVWCLLLLHAAIRPITRVWQEQSWLAVILFGGLPLLNAITTERHFVASVQAGDWVFIGFDLSMLMFGLLFAAFGCFLQRRFHKKPENGAAILKTSQSNRLQGAK